MVLFFVMKGHTTPGSSRDEAARAGWLFVKVARFHILGFNIQL